ncbi:hypothetical protein KF728_25795 [Candidatus Obscuribacterales bacterium]|nr:hypothetical protein [Candidatus Obscuribacterales bacterium]
MEVHLLDGTYELFRHYFGVPKSANADGQEIGAVRGVLASVVSMFAKGATHIGVATDHVIESFRNDLFPYYKTGEGIPEDLWSQFPLLEEALDAMGVKVWAMVEFEADDALAAAAHKAAQDSRVERVIICTPDKDLGQSVVGTKIVQMDRRRDTIRDEAGVIEKFGVRPESIPDFLGVVGDTADGIPGLPRWGAKAAAAVLSVYPHLEDIPKDPKQWPSSIRGASTLAATLFEKWDDAILYRTLATLRTDVEVFSNVDELEWKGPRPEFEENCKRLKALDVFKRAQAVAAPKLKA